MKKDKEWLKEQVHELFQTAFQIGKMEYYEADESVYVINELVNQLEEPEKVVVPQFVANYIETLKDNDFDLALCIYDGTYSEKVKDWLFEAGDKHSLKNRNLIMRAWLDGYEVEKEPQWVVRYEDGYFSEEIKFGCGIDGDWVDEVSRAYHFTDKAKAEAVALLIGGTVEERNGNENWR